MGEWERMFQYWWFFLLLAWPCLVTGQTKCCDSCIQRSPSYNNEAICNQVQRQFFVCPTLTTCRLANRGEYGIEVGVCQICPEGWTRNFNDEDARLGRYQTCDCVPCQSESGCSPIVNQYIGQVCTRDYQKRCCYNCAIGQYPTEACKYALEQSPCAACPAGKYRDSASMTVCQDCSIICDVTQRQRKTACGPVYNQRCETCSTGHIVTGAGMDVCTPCNPGTYARASDNTCASCKDCLREEKMVANCEAAADRSCTACPTGQRTRSLNSDQCLGCIPGYIRASDTCVLCNSQNANCASGRYINCKTNLEGNGDYDCLLCEGQAENPSCSEHHGVSTRCGGGGTTMVSCTPCAAGTERPTGTAQENSIQKCRQCLTGTFKAAAGASACGACSNKPANSVYASWGTTTATGNSCPWNCNAGYYKSGSSCVLCPTGQWSGTAGVTACQACTNGPANAYYLQRVPDTSTTTTNTCPWDCTTGYIRNSQTPPECVPCGSGKYREAKDNVAKEDASNICYPCTSCAAKGADVAGTYLTRACAYNRDTVCTGCSSSCPTGQYKLYECNVTSDVVCRPCATVCPAGKYKSSKTCTGEAFLDEVLQACVDCMVPSQCQTGFYLNKACDGTESEPNRCVQCSTNLCPAGQYRGGCTGYTPTTCLPYTVCASGYYLSDESDAKDGVCKQCSTCTGLNVMRACTKLDDTVCQGSPCGPTRPCPLLTSSNRSAYFCNYEAGREEASCGVCPPGYASDGQFCLECPRGFTCDRIGRVSCRGQCGASKQSGCEKKDGLGYATCTQDCTLPTLNSRIPWRGSYEGADGEDCATYFLCQPGFYKKYGSGGSISCEPCKPSLKPDRAAWVTEGLSVGDDASCLWECQPELASWNGSQCVLKNGRQNGAMQNAAGSWMGPSGVGGVCGLGRTSQALTAMAPEECLACEPLAGDVMRWKDRTDQCEFECLNARATKRGSVCVPERVVCRGEGLVGCAPLAYPWNTPGFFKTGWSVPVVASFVVSSVVTYPRLATLGYDIKGRHSVTASLGATSRQVEGQLCSAATMTLGGKAYVFGSLCNQSFLVYLDLSTPTGKGLAVLIGNSTRGWRDGFRTQALFESELYVATQAGSEGSVFVLDRWNCLLREVRVWASDPGDYRTRSYTLWGNTDKLVLVPPEPKCYGPGSLAWPRRFWPLRYGWLAFGDEDGLWQFNTRTRELLEMIREDLGQFEVDGLFGIELLDPYTLVLAFLDGVVWVVRATQVACAQDTTSLPGGDCTVDCYWKDATGASRRWVDQTTGLCMPCTTPVCGNGEELVGCSPTRDAYCRACLSDNTSVYTEPGTCDAGVRRPVPPCVVGWYLAPGGRHCEECPAFTATQYAGATRFEQCKCVAGLTRKGSGGACVGERLYDFEEGGACGNATSCAVPRNAQIVAGDNVACRWTCNAGFYRDTVAGFDDQCRACLAGSGRTRGDDDQPWSCE